MADVITRFKIETTQFDSKLRDASKELADIGKKAAEAGKGFDGFTKESLDAAKALGNISTSANNAKGKVQELVGAYNDVARAYDKLTQDQKQSDFGKAMAGSLQQLQVRIREAKQELYGLDDAAKKVSNGGLFSGDKLSGMLQVFGGNLMTKGAMMISNFAAEMGDMVKQGIEMAKAGEGIRIAFERLGRGDLLDGLREATHGTVTDLELMKAAVKFNDFKLPVEELGTMLAFAQQKAKDTGQSVDYMVDSIVTGLGRKSLMILDNLGLSAADIKEKMAQTGDMTKAVGEIIREQMSKAGEYVKTAADEATQANVSLENAMTNLGNTLQPLASNFNTFWTDIKVSGLNFLNEVLSPIISQLTVAGQKALALRNMGGSAEVNTQIDTLANSKTKQITMLSQLAQYDAQLKELQGKLDNVSQLSPGLGGALLFRQQRTAFQGQYDAISAMREEYRKRAMEILAPATATGGTGGGGAGGSGGKGGSTGGDKYTPLVGSIDFVSERLKDLTTQFKQTADEGVRAELLPAIEQCKFLIDAMNQGMSMTLERSSSSGLTEHLGLGMGDLSKLQIDPNTLKITTDLAAAGDAAKASWSDAMSAINGVGSALAGIEDPAVKVLGIVAEAIATIALTFAKSLKGTFTPWDWIAGAAAGTATMISTIAAIKSATSGFAGGGIVPGNSYSGDNIRGITPSGDVFGLNSGEVVLNRAQVGVLGSSLQQQAANNRQVLVTKVKGTDLLVMLDQTGKLTGKGELMFWR